MERLTDNPTTGAKTQASSQFIQVERERERSSAETTVGSSSRPGSKRCSNGSICTTEQARSAESMVADSDSGGKLRVLDKQLLGEADTHTHTQRGVGTERESITRTERGRTAFQMDVDAPLTGEQFLTYWLWRCRDDQNDWSPHPLGLENKKLPG